MTDGPLASSHHCNSSSSPSTLPTSIQPKHGNNQHTLGAAAKAAFLAMLLTAVLKAILV